MRRHTLQILGPLVFLFGTAVFGSPEAGMAQGTGEFPHGTFPEGLGCLDCHTTEGWKPIQADPVFDHFAVTGFPLLGKHATASCQSCHEDLHFEKAQASPDECGTCHTDVHSGSLSANCSTCHTPTSFRDIDGLNIHQTTGFLLEGAHLQISCEACHVDDEGGSFSPLPTDCLACHQEEFTSPKEVDHVALDFPSDCLTCHTPNSWAEIGAFDHATFSGGFQLQGAHQEAQCTTCHIPGGGVRFQPSGPQDCVACHQSDYQREHSGSGYPQDCTLCHGQGTWDREDFDHASISGGFGLAGAHEELACTNCHSPGGTEVLFNPADQNDCISCHLPDYQEEHAASGFPTTCLDCHTIATWDGAVVDHASLSNGFQLPADHGALDCTNCHTPDGATLFTPSSPTDCVTCHTADYQREHSGSGFPEDCTVCHTTAGWDGATTDHTTISGGFGLLGNHGLLPCTSCHIPGGTGTTFDPATPEDCVACHQTDFQTQHAGSGYPETCLSCHVVTTWAGATVDHSAVSGGFALPSDHEGLDCTSCHTPDGSGTLFSPANPQDCVACHTADYQREHSGSGYPTDCTVCHTTTGWEGVSADHGALSGGFNLVGNHDALPCTSCHVPESTETLFDPTTPEDCLACHLGDFQREHSTPPGFPTSCLSCHVVTAWGGSPFNHDRDFFPIYSGKHEGEWSACTQCHTDPSDPTDFTCLTCHKHNKSDTDQDHSEVQNYVYESGSCLSCHPTGNG